MAHKEIIIVSNERDPHVDRAIAKMRQAGCDPVRVHPSSLLEHGELTLQYDGPALRGTIRTGSKPVAIENIGSIWWRRPKPLRFSKRLHPDERLFAKAEAGRALAGLWGSIDCNWMSRPWLIDEASNKPEQLHRARSLGFEIPRTLVTTNPRLVPEFFDQCRGKMIYKPLAMGALSAYDRTFNRLRDASEPLPQASLAVKTTLLSREDILQHGDSVELAPCLFQEYVEKRVELRVTVIGDEIFAAEIDSQAQTSTKTDWRNYDVPMLIKPARLPDRLQEMCLNLVRSYGLSFSAIDLIQTPDGRYVFLENNPNGQWMFVEVHIPAFRMTDALISFLAGPTRSQEPVQRIA